MKFKYNERIYNPVNLEKKLKKLGITIKDIEIIQEEKKQNSEINEYFSDKEQRIIRSTLDNIRRVVYIPKESNITAEDFFRNWKAITYPDSFYKTLYYE